MLWSYFEVAVKSENWGYMLLIHGRLSRWRKWKSCDIGQAKEGLENELWRKWSDGKFGEWAELILQPFIYVTTHSPILPSLYLRHSSFSKPSVASPTSQFILQPLFRLSYVTSSSLNSPGEPPMDCRGSLEHGGFSYSLWTQSPKRRLIPYLAIMPKRDDDRL